MQASDLYRGSGITGIEMDVYFAELILRDV